MADDLAVLLAAALGSSYELGPLLGRGGMGAVYRATDRRLHREVAVKVLPIELGYSQDLRTRFVREAQMAAQLSHPNVVPIFDVGDSGGLVWFVMQFVDGESVRAKVEREGPQTISLVRRVLQEVAQALAYAHAKGVVHRDIKPDNIILDAGSGRAMVTDFGIAKALRSGDSELTRPGEIVGTARYMAPEQALAEATVDGRADMYSLGLVGFFVLTGTHAIKGLSLPAVIMEHVRGPAIDLTTADRRLPAPLVQAIMRCLAPRPEDRFARMEDFADALQELGGDLPETPAPVRRLLRDSERFFVITAVSCLALGFIGVERVPPGLVVLLGLLALGQWAIALEHTTRRGVTWAMVRRALYAERARRVEEAQEPGLGYAGVASVTAMLGAVAGVALLEPNFAPGTRLNMALLFGGTLGSVLAARVFGLPFRRPTTRQTRFQLALGVGGVLFFAAALAHLVREGVSVGVVLAAGAVFTAAVLAITVALVRKARRAPVAAREAPVLTEWRVPRWLDIAGSWLLGRLVQSGRRIRLERDQPVAATKAELNLSEAQRAERRIQVLASSITGTAAPTAAEARELARDLVGECRRADRELRPILAKVARLSEGVLASRTIAAGGSIESELDQAERDADTLRARARDCAEMLQALSVGLEGAAQVQDHTQLDLVMERARQLSSSINRATVRLEAQ